MKIAQLVGRPPPHLEDIGSKIPWNEPGFSRRMLREHLSQEHDKASRRLERIAEHVRALHERWLGGRPSRVLDLGCGPGLYTAELARHGHACVGIDFSPASIEYAREQAQEGGLDCRYVEADLLAEDSPLEGEGPFDLAMMLFGELDTFRDADASAILRAAGQTLYPGGAFLAEVQTEAFVRQTGAAAPSFHALPTGLFSDDPYLCLTDAGWSEIDRAAIERFTVLTDGAEPAVYLSTSFARSEADHARLFAEAGFASPRRHAAFGDDVAPEPGLVVLHARREEPAP
ncbi:MAG: class I SAM-dependent methyltransferase [Myxococcota bacterium]|nr:class I SAM-dependent methyltransferase [Myxococcota bacterium]